MLSLRAALRTARNHLTTARSHFTVVTRQVVDNHPVVTNAVVYGALYTLAEVSQQKLKTNLRRDLSPAKGGTGPQMDVSSVKRYAIMGTIVFPPILTKWYRWLDDRFPCTSRSVVAKKLVLDQFLLTPWLVAIFYIGMSYLEGERGESMLLELKQKFVKTFTLDCLYWLPIQALNFLFVPPGLRVAYIGITTFIWLNVLCYIKSSPN